MRTVPEIHTPPFRQMRFNIAFTRGTVGKAWRRGRIPAINHDASAFIENKRYRTNEPHPDDMVNRNGGFVYQTEQVFVVYSPRAGAEVTPVDAQDETSTEYVDVQKPHACAARRRILPQLWCRFRCGVRPRGGRTHRHLRQRSAGHGRAYGLRRALQHGRRLHPVPVRRRTAEPALLRAAAADVSAATLLLRAAGRDAADAGPG